MSGGLIKCHYQTLFVQGNPVKPVMPAVAIFEKYMKENRSSEICIQLPVKYFANACFIPTLSFPKCDRCIRNSLSTFVNVNV